MKWIDVNKKLPEKNKQVLLLVDGTLIQGEYKPTYNPPWNFLTLCAHGCGCCSSSEDNVTHWMTLESFNAAVTKEKIDKYDSFDSPQGGIVFNGD